MIYKERFSAWQFMSHRMRTLLLVLATAVISAAVEIDDGYGKDEMRYVVFPGLDAGVDEIAEWGTGYATPFNVYFGPKPYVVGWLGEGSFNPDDPEDPGIGPDDTSEEIGDPDDSGEDYLSDEEYPDRKNSYNLGGKKIPRRFADTLLSLLMPFT